MLQIAIYMIRNGNFGSAFEIKLYITIGAVFICLFDFITRHRKDYFYIFSIGTIIWGTIEFLVQITGIRVIEQAYLFNLPIPTFIAAILRGTSEGSAIAVMGIAFGDRVQEKSKKNIEKLEVWLVFIAMILIVVIRSILQSQPVKTIGAEVLSRRDVFTPSALIVLAFLVGLGIIWLVKTDSHNRRRGYFMLLMMILFSTAWTIAEVYANTRWIEWDIGNGLERAPPIIENLTLIYDIMIEIAFCYLPYLGLPYWFGWIKIPAPIPNQA
jgi:hypothetical protein